MHEGETISSTHCVLLMESFKSVTNGYAYSNQMFDMKGGRATGKTNYMERESKQMWQTYVTENSILFTFSKLMAFKCFAVTVLLLPSQRLVCTHLMRRSFQP